MWNSGKSDQALCSHSGITRLATFPLCTDLKPVARVTYEDVTEVVQNTMTNNETKADNPKRKPLVTYDACGEQQIKLKRASNNRLALVEWRSHLKNDG